MAKKVAELDVIIPVYNEGEGILLVLEALRQACQHAFPRAAVLRPRRRQHPHGCARAPLFPFEVRFVKNRRLGAHGAVVTGFEDSTAPACWSSPAMMITTPDASI